MTAREEIDRCVIRRGRHPGSRVCRSTLIEVYYHKRPHGPAYPVCGRCWSEYGGESAEAFKQRIATSAHRAQRR